jgi:hypothetical protein
LISNSHENKKRATEVALFCIRHFVYRVPLHEPGRYFERSVVPSVELPQRHAAMFEPATGAVNVVALLLGASEITPVASPPTFWSVTVMTPVEFTATADTNLV